jgi:Fe-S-cluster containining protein
MHRLYPFKRKLRMLRRSVCSTYQRIAAEKENEYDSIQIKCDQLMQEKLTIQKQFSEEKEKLNAQINYLQKINSLRIKPQ